MDLCHGDPYMVWEKPPVLCRLQPVRPLNGERFWLRMLLLPPGFAPTSFEDLYTTYLHEGTPTRHATFANAAESLGLQRNAQAARDVMRECVLEELYDDVQCRSLLHILTSHFDCSGHILNMIREFLPNLVKPSWPDSERLRVSLILMVRPNHVVARFLHCITDISVQNRPKRMQDLNQRVEACGELITNIEEEVQAAMIPVHPILMEKQQAPEMDILPEGARLNDEQRTFFNQVHDCVKGHPLPNPRLFHLDVQAGAGKTFLCEYLANAPRVICPQGVICTAFTAKAARNYVGGQTCHCAFTLNVTEPEERPTLKILEDPKNRMHASRTCLRDASLIIMDEISMMRAAEFDAIWDGLKRIGFQGSLIAAGNDAQLGPVIPDGTPNSLLLHHITTSNAFHASETVHATLRMNMRMATDAVFQDVIHRIGYEEFVDQFESDGSQQIDLCPNMFSIATDTDVGVLDARRWTHPSMFACVPELPFGAHVQTSIIVTATRALEAEHNEFFVRQLPGEEVLYCAHDEFAAVPGRDGSAICHLSDDIGPTLDDSGAPCAHILLKPGTLLL
jgi:hypothetical protein